MTRAFFPLGVVIERICPECPGTLGEEKPCKSFALIEKVVSPIWSELSAQPLPRITAISCASWPDFSAIISAARRAEASGS